MYGVYRTYSKLVENVTRPATDCHFGITNIVVALDDMAFFGSCMQAI
jgi:hypothetical protein